MALIINTNIAALNSQKHLNRSNSMVGKSLERLSSGLRINKAADDAAGLALATKLHAQVRGLSQAIRNANNAIALVQTAEGGINTVTNILQRIRELAVQASSEDNTAADRKNLAKESDQLVAELNRQANTTEYNTMALLDGTFTNRVFQIGAQYAQTISITIQDSRGKTLGGRAQYDADITDGLTNAMDANFGGSEFRINNSGIQATNATDDQYSVISFASAQIGTLTVSEFAVATGFVTSASNANFALSLNLTINSVAVGVRLSVLLDSTETATSLASAVSTVATGASIAAGIVDAVNDNNSLAALNITARAVGSEGWVVERTGGGELKILVSMYGSTDGSGAATINASYSVFSLFLAGASLDSNVGYSLGSMNGGVSLLSLLGDGATVTSMGSTPTLYNSESSAIAKAVAINSVRSSSGVTATARANVVTAGTAIAAGTINSGDFYINGVNIGTVTTLANDGNGALATAINAQSSSTGVTATTDANGKLVLTAADGRNITITAKQDTTAGYQTIGTSILGVATNYFSGTTALFRSTIRLTDDDEFSLSGTLADLYDAGTTDANNVTKTTDSSKSVATDLSTYNLTQIDISTLESAQAAILTIDAAFDDVNSNRAEIGAIQNRLEFTVANLEVAAENMAASESRIRDADFAAETAIFTKNQILIQAGTAMLAQANTLPQIALQLLQ